MGIKLHILLLVAFFPFNHLLADEKFLSISGVLIDEETRQELTDYSVKVVEDRIDSSTTTFSKPEFEVWAPANRRSNVYFIKDGYVIKHIFIDASYIPSIAFKKKQEIVLEIQMTPAGKAGKRDFTAKPIMTAEYFARDNAFKVTVNEDTYLNAVPADYSPPFSTPVDTYKGVQPSVNTLVLTGEINESKAKPGSEYCTLIQGILFADLNYCFFNERTNDANEILARLVAIDADRWSNLKPFDSPEYGKIVMRTVNREQGIDTLFALGSFVETSRLIFENFTSDSKVVVHLKKLKEVLLVYAPSNLSLAQADFMDSLRGFIPLIAELESKYTESLRTRNGFILADDPSFQAVKQKNQAVYSRLIE